MSDPRIERVKALAAYLARYPNPAWLEASMAPETSVSSMDDPRIERVKALAAYLARCPYPAWLEAS